MSSDNPLVSDGTPHLPVNTTNIKEHKMQSDCSTQTYTQTQTKVQTQADINIAPLGVSQNICKT